MAKMQADAAVLDLAARIALVEADPYARAATSYPFRGGAVRRAIEYYEQSLAIAREIGDRRSQGATLGNLGLALFAMGKVRQDVECYEQHLAIAREIGDRRGEVKALSNWAEALERLGEKAKALNKAEAALAIFEQIEDPNVAKTRELVERLRDRLGESDASGRI